MKTNIYKLDNIDCALCATKIEEKLNKLNGIISCNLNFMTLSLLVSFNEDIISDEEIEINVHKPVKGIKIIKKNNQEFVDIYEEEKVFKKIFFREKNKKQN